MPMWALVETRHSPVMLYNDQVNTFVEEMNWLGLRAVLTGRGAAGHMRALAWIDYDWILNMGAIAWGRTIDEDIPYNTPLHEEVSELEPGAITDDDAPITYLLFRLTRIGNP